MIMFRKFNRIILRLQFDDGFIQFTRNILYFSNDTLLFNQLTFSKIYFLKKRFQAWIYFFSKTG